MNKEGETHPLLYYIDYGCKVGQSMAKQGKVRQGKAGEVKAKAAQLRRSQAQLRRSRAQLSDAWRSLAMLSEVKQCLVKLSDAW